MSPTVVTLIAVLCVWMLACAWCGFRARIVMFLAVLLGGLAANQLWMMIGLKAKALEYNLIFAQLSAMCFAVFALGCGWLAGRVARQWQASRVEDA